MDGTTSILTQDLKKDFGQVKALKGVSLSVEQGQIFGLLGPNGAGKTTFIRLLIGSTRPSGGSISVLEMDPIKQKQALRRFIGYMPQEPALYEDLSAHENIRFFNRAYEIEKLSQRVDEVIEFVGLGDRARDPVYQFSGGMKQRVSLACALARRPKLLFLDEPTSGIDPKLRESFWRHFHDLTSQGITLVVSTHQMDEAMYCDRLAVLHRGSVLASDTPRRLIWNNRAKITINVGDEVVEEKVANYPEELPKLLHPYGLDPTVSRISVEEDTLETVVLRMIDDHESGEKKEVNNGRNP